MDTDNKQSSAPEIYSVSALNAYVRQLLESGLGQIWVEGEISNLARPASGHMYFSLKDDKAQIRCALFRGQNRYVSCSPEDGMQVLVRARVSLYEARGDYQLIVEHVEAAGEGALRRAFEQLKKRLHEEGLFDAGHKQAIPELPKRIAVITSESGAVLHDIQQTLLRRFPAITLCVLAVPVQGEKAAPSVVNALQYVSRTKNFDAVIIARGGGSLEDLWAFNEESVARAVFTCPIPVVSAIGHETDFTITDFVADLRAPTPTAAAELLSPDQDELLLRFQHVATRMTKHLHSALAQQQQKLDGLSIRVRQPGELMHRYQMRLVQGINRLSDLQNTVLYKYSNHNKLLVARLLSQNPTQHLEKLAYRCHYLQQRMHGSINHTLNRRNQLFKQFTAQLHTLSPLATIERGYAIVEKSDTHEIIRSVKDVHIGEHVSTKLADGQLECTVEKIKK